MKKTYEAKYPDVTIMLSDIIRIAKLNLPNTIKVTVEAEKTE